LTAVSVTAQNDIGSHCLTIAQDIGRVGEQEAESILWNFPQSLDNIITMPVWVSSPSDPNPVPELDGFVVEPIATEAFQKLCEVSGNPVDNFRVAFNRKNYCNLAQRFQKLFSSLYTFAKRNQIARQGN
jgi:hypothetical protein